MVKFIAQRGEMCLLTAEAYCAVMESPHFLPVSLAGWAPENDNVVGYIEGETLYRLVNEKLWETMLKDYRQRMLGKVFDDLKRRGIYDPQTDCGSDYD